MARTLSFASAMTSLATLLAYVLDVIYSRSALIYLNFSTNRIVHKSPSSPLLRGPCFDATTFFLGRGGAHGREATSLSSLPAQMSYAHEPFVLPLRLLVPHELFRLRYTSLYPRQPTKPFSSAIKMCLTLPFLKQMKNTKPRPLKMPSSLRSLLWSKTLSHRALPCY